MAAAWLGYLAALLLCGIFYIAYGEWFSFLALTLVAGLPWLSLVLSLPAMLTFRIGLEGAQALQQGTPGQLWLQGSCALPMPRFWGGIRLKGYWEDKGSPYDPKKGLPTAHCGGYAATGEKVRIYDYLGLFFLPVRCREPRIVKIRPNPVPIRQLPELETFLARSWRPKFGGGYAENHELRLYRPGDNLNQVHWKLTAKTGKWMLREPMEPQRGLVLLTMELRGTPVELDRKLGRLLWLGNHLLEKNIAFRLRVLTGQGLEDRDIGSPEQLLGELDALLCSPLASEGTVKEGTAASWQYHIGGEPDEA
ncbi:MAG: DUF58 domain-containing protein [Oscillospiraceae bacterium]|nr:DUF58 domain-containing protein [Oscillospiraceae bacterium]